MIATWLALPMLTVALVAAEPDPRSRAAQAQAQTCADATVKGDIGKVADLTHPRLLALVGGREKMIEKTRLKLDQLRKDGVSYVSATAGAPEPFHAAGNALYCVVPLTYRVKASDQRFLFDSPLIGVSFDSGKTWKFIDTAPGEANVRKLVPVIPRDLKFPPETEPRPDPKPEKP